MCLLRSIVLAYAEHNTPIIDRIYYSWFGGFLCRIWQTWLRVVGKEEISEFHSGETINNLFITTPAHFSIELNAHSLLGICLLVIQQKLPESALSISNYHSQSCESTFRLTRSMSGSFSCIVNFTIEQFLKRAGKLSVLTDIEQKSESGQLKCPLKFPKHHKRQRKRAIFKKSAVDLHANLFKTDNIQKTIDQAFDDAYDHLAGVDVNIALEMRRKNTVFQVSSFVRSQFNKKYKNVPYDDNEIYSSDDEYNYKYEIDSSGNIEEDTSEDEENISSLSASGKSQFHGMRVFDNIPPSLSKSYFSAEIDGKKNSFISRQLVGCLRMKNRFYLLIESKELNRRVDKYFKDFIGVSKSR